MRELMVHLWKNTRLLPGRDGRVIIRFVISRTGHAVSAIIEKSSGDAVLDKAALAMVRQAHPVPLPPPCLTDQNLIVHAPLNFHS
jgi:protein TonB